MISPISPTTTPSFAPALDKPYTAPSALGTKTYIDEQYKYQADYPQAFSDANEVGVDVLFGSKLVGITMYRQLIIDANPNRATIDTIWFINEFDKLLGRYYSSIGASPNLTLERIIVAGKSAVKVSGQRHDFMNVVDINMFIPKGQDILQISFTIHDNLSSNLKAEAVNDFVSTFYTTFRFLD